MSINGTGWFLLDNVLAQMKELEMMQKRPRALRCDRHSIESFARSTGLAEILLSDARVFGLVIEIDDQPNFEVVE